MRMELIQKLRLHQPAAEPQHAHSEACAHGHGHGNGSAGHSHSHGPHAHGGHGHSHGPAVGPEAEQPHVHGPNCAHGHGHGGAVSPHLLSMQQKLKAKYAAAHTAQEQHGKQPHVHSAACRHGHGPHDAEEEEDDDGNGQHPHHQHPQRSHPAQHVKGYTQPTLSSLSESDLLAAYASLRLGSASLLPSTPVHRISYAASPADRPLSASATLPSAITFLPLSASPSLVLAPPAASSSPCSVCDSAQSSSLPSNSSPQDSQSELRLHHSRLAAEVEQTWDSRVLVNWTPASQRMDISRFPDCIMEMQELEQTLEVDAATASLLTAEAAVIGTGVPASGSVSKNALKKAKRRAREKAKREEASRSTASTSGTAPHTQQQQESKPADAEDEEDDEEEEETKQPAPDASPSHTPSTASSSSNSSSVGVPVTILRVVTRVVPPPVLPPAAPATWKEASATIAAVIHRHELIFPAQRLRSAFSPYQLALDFLLPALRAQSGEDRLYVWPAYLQLWTDRSEWGGVAGTRGDGRQEAADEEERDRKVMEQQLLVNQALTAVRQVWAVRQMSCNVFPLGHAARLQQAWDSEQAEVKRFLCL